MQENIKMTLRATVDNSAMYTTDPVEIFYKISRKISCWDHKSGGYEHHAKGVWDENATVADLFKIICIKPTIHSLGIASGCGDISIIDKDGTNLRYDFVTYTTKQWRTVVDAVFDTIQKYPDIMQRKIQYLSFIWGWGQLNISCAVESKALLSREDLRWWESNFTRNNELVLRDE